MREADLISIWIAEALVLRDEIVQVSGAVAPVAEDEKRWLDGNIFELGFEAEVAPSPKTVFDALEGDGRSAQP